MNKNPITIYLFTSRPHTKFSMIFITSFHIVSTNV